PRPGPSCRCAPPPAPGGRPSARRSPPAGPPPAPARPIARRPRPCPASLPLERDPAHVLRSHLLDVHRLEPDADDAVAVGHHLPRLRGEHLLVLRHEHGDLEPLASLEGPDVLEV